MKKLFTFVLALFVPIILMAQYKGENIAYFMPKGDHTYNPAITTPVDFFGFELGGQHVTTSQIYNYLELLSEQSERFSFEYHGYSYEKRPFMYVTITSKQNHENIDAIVQKHHDFIDPTDKSKKSTEGMPVVVWLGYSVHGNEASGINGAVAAAYFLAAAQGDEIENIMNNSVIILHPIINPDGSDRFASWVNSNRSFTSVSDPMSREFNQPWPGSRSNHYWFDLNRDILYVQHPESQSKVDMYSKWLPNVVNDHHEQGSNSHFFFMPGVKSRTNILTHRDNWDLTNKVAMFHAKELDNVQTMYFKGENFDDYYYGKGSTYPDIHGAVGMLFEQGSSRGHIRMTTNGVLTLAMGSRNQTLTSISSIKAAVAMREELLNHQRESYREAYVENQSKGFDGYIIGGKNSKGVNKMFLDILLRQGIEVYQLNNTVKSDRMAFDKENSYFVPAAQKETRKLNTIFENATKFIDSSFYDISAWTLTEAANINTIKVNGNYKGQKLTSIVHNEGLVYGEKSDFGYLMPLNEYFAHKAIYELQSQGLRVKVATRAFEFETTNGVKTFDNGTILVQVPNQTLSSFEISELVKSISQKYSIDFYALNSGGSESIQIGSGAFTLVRQPKVALLTGNGIRSLEAGEAWFLFDQRMQMPLTLLDVSYVSEQTLENYNTLLVYGNPQLSASARVALKVWCQNGGTIITNVAGVRMTNEMGLTGLVAKENKYTNFITNYSYVNQKSVGAGRSIGGVILRSSIDTSHPLCYGYNQAYLSVFHSGTTFFKDVKDKFNMPLRYTKNPVVSGYVSKDNVKNIDQSSSLYVGSAGRGKVVVFVSNPNFRGFWFGTQKLFYNAIFFSPNVNAQKIQSVEIKK